MPPTRPSRAPVAGVAPAWVGHQVAGPARPATVLHAGADAIYIRAGQDVIAVISRHAVPVPCAIATRAATIDDLFGSRRPPAAGDPVILGGGLVDFGGVAVRVGRIADYAMPPVAPETAATMRNRLRESRGGAGTGRPSQETSPAAEFDADVLALLRDRPARALEHVLGRGSGLTPVGDDIVCGLLATLLAAGDACAPSLRKRVLELAPDRTTSLSATLLRRAADGDALPLFADVARELGTGEDPGRAQALIERLGHVGHTSGAGMLLGLELALDHLTTCHLIGSTRSCRP